MTVKLARLAAAVCVATLGLSVAAQAEEEVNVYSLRQPELIKPLFDAFTKETGIKVNVVFAREGLVERLKSEGANSPADVLLTVDIGRLQEAVEEGVAQPVKSAVLEKNIPAQYRDPNGLWYGLTQRARVIVTSKERVKEGEIKNYEDLADPKWKGKICTRSAKHVYNVALIASMIANHNGSEAEKWLAGVKANLAQKPQGGDRDQIKAVAAGICDIAISNTYYIAGMLNDEKEAAAAKAINVVFPNQGGRGTHVNISGALLAKNAPHKANGVKLMEFLSSDEAQRIYAEVNYEYPVKPGIEWAGILKQWGQFKADTLPLATVAEKRKDAIKLADKVNFDG